MAGQRKALIVANDKYEQEGLRNLRAPAADAEGLRRVLSDPKIGEFAVQVVRNEPAHVIHAQIEELFVESKPDDVLLLHFSCHGLKSESGELFFAAANTRSDRLGSTAVSAEFVQRSMRATRSRTVVLLLDCCYGGAFAQGVTVRASGDVQVLDSFPQERLGGGRGRAIISASGAMEFAIEGTRLADNRRRRPSVFTAALIEGLRTGDADRDQDGWVSLDELYDYVFDKVREQNPHQTPNRHIELAGAMYLARSPKRPVRAASALPGPQIPARNPSAPARSASSSETPGQPSDTPDSWRGRIDTNRSLYVGWVSEPDHLFAVPAMVLPLGFAADVAWLAQASQPSAWLSVAAATGIASLVGLSLQRKMTIRLILRLFSLPCITIYIMNAFSGTEDWAVRGWIGGTLILYALAAFTIQLWKNEAEANVKLKAAGERQERVIETVRTSRWLTADRDPAVSVLLDPLDAIPAARFAIVPEGPLRFLAASGRRIMLGAFVDWPTGVYTHLSEISQEIYRDGQLYPAAAADFARIIAVADEWSNLLSEIYGKSLWVVVVVRPVTHAQAGTTMLHFLTQDGKINVTTPDGFADLVGSFLADDPYDLNPRVLELLHSHLAGTNQTGTATVAALDPPSAASAAPSQKPISRTDSDRIDNTTVLPDPSQFDSVAADSMRYAASHRRLSEGLDTCTVLLALAQVHVRGRWDRIWLHCTRSLEDIARACRTSAIRDPVDYPRESWNDIQLTATCAQALRKAARIGSHYDLPISPGVLLLGLISDPASAAAQALGVGVTIEHDYLRQLVEDDLLDVSGIRDTD